MKNFKNIFLVITLATASHCLIAADDAAVLEMVDHDGTHSIIDSATHQTVHVNAAQEAAIKSGKATTG
jgi:hypothetical protein